MALPDQIKIADMYIKLMGVETIHALFNWYRYKDGYWQKYPEPFIKKEIVDLLKDLNVQHTASTGKPAKFTDSTVRGVCNIIKYQLTVKDDLIDNYPDLINMRNGVYNVKTAALSPHDPQWYITSQLPFDYDSEAVCPMWDRYIASTFVDRDGDYDHALAMYVRQAMGYSMTYDVSENVMFWCLGSGANGKSVLVHILKKLTGDASVPLDISGMERNKYSTVRLIGMKVAYATEADSGSIVSMDGTVKSIVDGEPITVRDVREKSQTLVSTAKIWWLMNSLPYVRDTSDGFWRRVKIIPFNRQFTKSEAIPNLRTELEDELSGIFNWCMDGLESLKEQGFIESRQVNELVKEERKSSNPVQEFISDTCLADKAHTEMATPLWKAYKDWCFENGYKSKNRNNFKKEVENLRFFYRRTTKGTEVSGLQLKSTSPFSI